METIIPYLVNASGVGLGVNPVTKMQVLANREQLRLGFDANNYTSFTTNVGGNLILEATGKKIGLNTNSPDGTLHVMTDSAGSVTAHADADDFVVEHSGINGGISILSPSTFLGNIFFGTSFNNDAGKIAYQHTTDASDAFFFHVNGGSTATLYIENSKVGINTVSPTYTLSVNGNMGITEYIRHEGDGDTYLRYTNNQVDVSAGGVVGVRTNATETVINDDSEDFDFRVESNNNTHMLYVDGTNNRVGVNNSTPMTSVDVKEGGTGSGSGGVSFSTASSGGNAGCRWTTNNVIRWSMTTIGASGVENLRIRDEQGASTVLTLTNVSGGSNGSLLGINDTSPSATIDAKNTASASGVVDNLIVGLDDNWHLLIAQNWGADGNINYKMEQQAGVGSANRHELLHFKNGNVGVANYLGTTSITTETPTGTTETIDWNNGNTQILDLSSSTGNVTLTLTAPNTPGWTYLRVKQHGTTPRTLTWPASVRWPGGTKVALTASTSAEDWFSFFYDGTNYDYIGANVS